MKETMGDERPATVACRVNSGITVKKGVLMTRTGSSSRLVPVQIAALAALLMLLASCRGGGAVPAAAERSTSASANADIPTLQVTAGLPGASPQTMVSAVAHPLEREFCTMTELARMSSTSVHGITQVTLRFSRGRDLDAAARDVQAAIMRAMRDLPENASQPTYVKLDPNDMPVLLLALTDPAGQWQRARLHDFAQSLMAARISMVSGVGQVQFLGGHKFAIRIQLDPVALTRRGITIDEVADAVQAGNVNSRTVSATSPDKAGTFEDGDRTKMAGDYGTLVVAMREGQPVRLSDVGTVVEGVENDRTAAWFGDRESRQDAIVLAVFRQPGTRPTDLADAVNALVPRLREQLPPSIHLNVLNPRTADRVILCRTEAAQDLSFQSLARHQEVFDQILAKDPDLESFISTASAPGLPGKSNTGLVWVILKGDRARARAAERVIEDLRPKLAQIPGLAVRLRAPTDGRLTAEQYQYVLQGSDPAQLYDTGSKLLDKLRRVDGLVDLASDLAMAGPELNFLLDRDKAAKFGVTIGGLENTLYVSLGGRQIATIFAPTDQYKVILELLPKFQAGPETLATVTIRSVDGKLVPLKDIAKLVQDKPGPVAIHHFGLLPSVTLSWNLEPGVSPADARTQVEKSAQETLPPTVTGQFVNPTP